MKKVLVTGSSGFLGQNTVIALKKISGIEVIEYTRENTIEELHSMIDESDFIFHLAAVMRPSDESAFKEINVQLTEQIINSVISTERVIPVVFTSSVQADLDNPYGKSKKEAEKLLKDWSNKSHNPVFIFRLTNIFGPLAKPDNTSVVATFCRNIIQGIPLEIHDASRVITFGYVGDVMNEFIKILQNNPTRVSPDTFLTIPRTFDISIGGLADKIKELHEFGLPEDASPTSLDAFLYITLRSYYE